MPGAMKNEVDHWLIVGLSEILHIFLFFFFEAYLVSGFSWGPKIGNHSPKFVLKWGRGLNISR